MGDYNKLDGIKEIPVPCEVISTGVLKLGRLTNRVKAQYEDWMEARARKRVFDLRASLDKQEFLESMQAVQEACASGSFSWGGDAWLSSLRQLPGRIKMIVLLANDEKVTESAVLGLAKLPEIFSALASEVRALLESSPNFLYPPIRGNQSDPESE